MTPSSPLSIERLYDLLATQATQPLTRAEELELRQLLTKWPHVDATELELMAAAVSAATVPTPYEELSPQLVADLEAAAGAYFTPSERRPPPRSPWNSVAISGWTIAACLLVSTGLLAWELIGTRSRQPSVLAQRTQLLQAGGQRFRSQDGASDVVWDSRSQQGVLNVRGLPPNVPTQKQYQLWIVDPGRSHPEPVDGGVFDAAADGTAMIAIKPALTVRTPTVFAITEEPPGGVVVSERGKRAEFVVVMTAGQ